jgi:putative transposase
MNHESNSSRRHSTRLKGYDYSLSGAYFITIKIHQSRNGLGTIKNGNVQPSKLGEIVEKAWFDLPNHYHRIELDAFVIMPDHVHGIIVLVDDSDRRVVSDRKSVYGLSEIVRAFKSFSARRINSNQKTTGQPFWQRGYFERIIRNENEWEKIREYIISNPTNWPKETKLDFQ